MPRGSEKKKALIEVRRDLPLKGQTEGEIDEVCGKGTWHFEMMNDSQMSVMLYGEAGDVLCLFIEPKHWPKRGGVSHVRARVLWYDQTDAAQRQGVIRS